MAKELKLIGNRYTIIALIFFIPYVIFQPPATVVLRKVGPRNFLAAITVLWGACMIVCLPFLYSHPHFLSLTLSVLRLRQRMGTNGRPPHYPRCP